jgi:deazaflavin-dependent oxidoreductase (nitroreductase family)
MSAKDTFHKVSTRIHRAIFKASKGRLLGTIVGLPVVELVTTGRRSGQQRSTMLAAPIVEDDRVVLVASFGGDDRQPAWYRNLTAHPRVRVTTAGSTLTMLARTATDQERAQLWPQITARYQGYARYQQRTERPIPVVILQPDPPPQRIPRSMQATTSHDRQGAHDVTTRKQPGPATDALRSLLGIEALSLLTSIHHLEEFGVSFLVPAALLVSLPLILMWWVLQQRSRAARLSYATLVTLVIVGFGLQDGLWNHTVKMAVFFLRGADRAEMAGLPFPPVGSVFHEVTGVLAFVAAIFAAYFGYQFITKTRKLPPATRHLGRVRA